MVKSNSLQTFSSPRLSEMAQSEILRNRHIIITEFQDFQQVLQRLDFLATIEIFDLSWSMIQLIANQFVVWGIIYFNEIV